MPGRRNLAKERSQHALEQPARQLQTFTELSRHYPDHALIGTAAILAYLHTTLQLRRLNHQRLTWRIVLSWRRAAGFPLLRGHRVLASARTPAITTTHAVTAWALSQFSTAHLFTVAMAQQNAAVEASTPRTSAAA